MKRKKTQVIFVRADEKLKSQLEKVEELTGATMSEFTRAAIREKLRRMAREYPELSNAA